ncbi:MAG: CerR family C-terminal domain-containing protein [Planctomycetes bacterium]|nr:CerR family C-terminal domain-containing protein [Planctomycetota bacterium]
MVAPTEEFTRQRLLQAAGEEFAAKGFRETTIRAICRRAGANIAAVNYHFRNKEQLYLTVLEESQAEALAKYPNDYGLGPDPTPADRLHAFVRSFLLRMFDSGRPAWHGKLLARELFEPTAALDALVAADIRPRAQLLRAIVTDLTAGVLSDDELRRTLASIVGQCLFYQHARPVLARLFPGFVMDAKEIDAVASHITRVGLAACEALAAQARMRARS